MRLCLLPRFLFLVFILGLLLTACGNRDEPEHYRIGVLNFAESTVQAYEGFKDGMDERGYPEGERVTYIYEYTENTPEALLAAANRLVEQNVDMIVALATPAALAAQEATSENRIPVLFVPINDPVGSGLVESLNHPGGNLTGIRGGGHISKQLEWLLRIDPDIELIFAPHNPNDSSSSLAWQELQTAAEPWGVNLLSPEVTSPDEVTTAIAAMPDEADAIFLAGDAMIANQIDKLVAVSLERNTAVSTFSLQHVQDGVLMCFGFEFYPVGRQAARLGEQIIEGVAPSDLPVETAEFVLSINLVTAESIDLNITDDILRQAQNIIRESE